MSQAGIISTTSGPVPPTVPTQFTADDATIAIPVANNLNVFSRETRDNNISGVQTTADPNGSQNLFLELTNRATGAIGTNDATPANAIVFAMAATPTVYVLDGLIVAHNTTVESGAGYFFTAAARTTGVTGTLISAPEFGTEFEEAALNAADVDVTVTGNNINIVVTGIAATAIDWLAQFTYTQVI